MTDYYEELGVGKDATNEQLRAAYRRKAKQHHPDRKGGDPQRMSAVNKAYDVLSSPQRRLTYDRLGADQPLNHVEQAARDQVLQRFINWLGADDSRGDMCMAVQTGLSKEIAQLNFQISLGHKAIEKLKKRYKRLKFKGKGPNLIGRVLDAKLDDVRKGIEQIKQNIEVLLRAGEMIKDFEYDAETPEPPDIRPHPYASELTEMMKEFQKFTRT